MGRCLFRLDLLTDHELSGVCPSRALQRPRPGAGWKVPIVPPCQALLRPGTGALRDRARRNIMRVISGFMERGNRRQTFGKYDDSSYQMAHGSWENGRQSQMHPMIPAVGGPTVQGQAKSG